MKKFLIGLGIIVGVLICLSVIARVTGALQFYKVRTIANQPSLKVGSLILSSRFIAPKRYNFICYQHADSMGSEVLVHRICGIPGDTVQIKEGNLFVNGKPADEQLPLTLNYLIPQKSYQTVDDLVQFSDDEPPVPFDTDQVLVQLTQENCKALTAHNIPWKRFLRKDDISDDYISHLYGHPWNEDNFGPVVVPADQYFVLGDNRYRAQDSRYTGFIAKADLYGTVLSRK